jgi:hypothetical protein
MLYHVVWAIFEAKFVINVPKVEIWDARNHLWGKYQLKNGFSFNAPNRPRYLFLWSDNMIV